MSAMELRAPMNTQVTPGEVPVHRAGLMARLRTARENGAVILPYIGWLGHDNVGDELVFDLFCNLLRTLLGGHPAVALVSEVSNEGSALRSFEWELADGAILGGGSTIDPFYVRKIFPAFDLALPVFCFAAGFQKDSALKDDEIEAIRRLEAVRFGSLRGPATRDVLRDMAVGDHLRLVMDGGYLAPVFYSAGGWTRVIADRIVSAETAGRVLVVINILNVDHARACILDFMLTSRDRYDFILLPSDPATLKSLEALQMEAGSACSTYLERDYADYSRLLAWYAVAAFSINMKLHASVLSSSVGTPAIGLGGGRKIDEYFASTNASSLRLRSFDAKDLRDVVAIAERIRADYARDTRLRLAQALRTHLDTLAEYLDDPSIARRLRALGPALTVTCIRGLDQGIVVVS